MHNISEFTQREGFEDLSSIVMLVIGMYTKSQTFLILIVTNSFDDEDIQALTFFLEFFAQYMLLFHIYNIDVTTMLPAKNICSAIYG